MIAQRYGRERRPRSRRKAAPAQCDLRRGQTSPRNPRKGPFEMRQQRIASPDPAHQRKRKQDPRSEAEIRLQAQQAAHTMHAKHDARKTTANGRAAFLARFEAEVDPEGTLPPEERRRRAEHARSAYFTRLALAAAKARRQKRDAMVIRMSTEDMQELVEEVAS